MTGDFHNSSEYNGTSWFLSDCHSSLDTMNKRVALFVLYLGLFMVGLVENSLVVWVNWRRRHSANGVLFCVINMGLSDLMMVSIMPFYMLEVTLDNVWLWGHFLCKVTYLVYVVNFYSSSFFLAFMTLERYLCLTRPSAPACFPPQRRRRWILCAGVWLLSLFLALLENVHVDLLEWTEPGCYMFPEQYHTEWYVTVSFLSMIFQFLGPASVIITCNVLIARAARTAPDVQDRRDVWLVHVYSLVFVACWLPYHLVLFMLTLDDLDVRLFSCSTVQVLYYSSSVMTCLSLFHCIANPILYNFLSKSFRSDLIHAVISRISPAAGAPSSAAVKERKLSSASTSHSDIGV